MSVAVIAESVWEGYGTPTCRDRVRGAVGGIPVFRWVVGGIPVFIPVYTYIYIHGSFRIILQLISKPSCQGQIPRISQSVWNPGAACLYLIPTLHWAPMSINSTYIGLFGALGE